MDLQRFAAFADGDRGGNPAGVVIADTLPPHTEMQRGFFRQRAGIKGLDFEIVKTGACFAASG